MFYCSALYWRPEVELQPFCHTQVLLHLSNQLVSLCLVLFSSLAQLSLVNFLYSWVVIHKWEVWAGFPKNILAVSLVFVPLWITGVSSCLWQICFRTCHPSAGVMQGYLSSLENTGMMTPAAARPPWKGPVLVSGVSYKTANLSSRVQSDYLIIASALIKRQRS